LETGGVRTALVTEIAPRRIRATMIVMGVVGVALGGGSAGLVAAQFMSIYGSRARDQPARVRRCPEQTEPARAVYACQPTSPISFSRITARGIGRHEELIHIASTVNAKPRTPAGIRCSATASRLNMIEVSERSTCFQRVISLFSLCNLLLEKSSKSLTNPSR